MRMVPLGFKISFWIFKGLHLQLVISYLLFGQRLPYLCTIIQETCCILSTFAVIFERVVPISGATIDGHCVSGSAVIGVDLWVVRRDAEVTAEEVGNVRQEKWLEEDAQKLKRMYQTMCQFVLGMSGRIVYSEFYKVMPSLAMSKFVDLASCFSMIVVLGLVLLSETCLPTGLATDRVGTITSGAMVRISKFSSITKATLDKHVTLALDNALDRRFSCCKIPYVSFADHDRTGWSEPSMAWNNSRHIVSKECHCMRWSCCSSTPLVHIKRDSCTTALTDVSPCMPNRV